MGGRAIYRAAVLFAALAIAVPFTAAAGQERPAEIACDEPDDLEVRVLKFSGNKAHSSYNLERGVATTASTWWRRTFRLFGQKYCLDSLHALVIDSARLDFHYRRTGFPDVVVRPSIRPLGGRKVAVEYRITEGQPMIMDSVSMVWEGIVPDSTRFTDNLPIKKGDRFDITVLESTRDTIRTRLLNRGYPRVEVLRNFDQYPAQHRATVEYVIIPGPKAWIGNINIPTPRPVNDNRRPRVDTARVREVLGVREGDLYNESALERAGRGLFATEAFRFVSVDTVGQRDNIDSLIDLRVNLSESELVATRASIGWANLDCLRAQVNHTNFNFLGLRRLDLNGRISKIGTSSPTEWAEGLCTSELLNDEVSDTLNYYAGVSISQAALFGLQVVPTISVYSELRSEFKAYLRDTPIGVIASAQQGLGIGGFPMTWSYQLEYGKTVAQPAFFCAVFNVCETEARERLERYTRSAVVGWAATRNRVNNVANPSSGTIMRVDLRHASPIVGSNKDASFNRATFDATYYTPAMGGLLVARLRAGTVLGSRLNLTANNTPRFIPLQERLYAGGPNSVRGFRQNEMGPAIYIPNRIDTTVVDDTLQIWKADTLIASERTVPTGGDNVIVANIELRRRAPAYPELVQYALFIDAGQVWNRGRAGTGVNFSDIRVTPGVGLRVFTPVGPVRVDVGYNPYRRPAGPAYITDLSGNLICVSPTNTLRVRVVEGQPPQQVDEGDCPATYAPRFGKSFWQRLTFQFSIGQPF